ncbi:MAG: hypothetical protein NXY59_09335 [Aigarchaeota archaeon]|nr:hypothetical protein [Candidatus Pelearchaeum maunauluense]
MERKLGVLLEREPEAASWAHPGAVELARGLGAWLLRLLGRFPRLSLASSPVLVFCGYFLRIMLGH